MGGINVNESKSKVYQNVYVWPHLQHLARMNMDQPVKVANPARGQLNSGNIS